MSLVFSSVLECKKMLTNLESWLDKGVAHAKARSFDSNVLLSLRLAPDQYSFLGQVQSACDSAKLLAARLAGKTAPKHPDTEQTVDDARARIHTCVSYLDGFQAADFDGAESRAVELPFLEGKVIEGSDYILEWGLPNFFFHVTTAYAILRHNGVPLGKFDYVGSLKSRDK
jgi:uncharacterized protein